MGSSKNQYVKYHWLNVEQDFSYPIYQLVYCVYCSFIWESYVVHIWHLFVKSRYQGKGQAITPHSICEMLLLVHVLDIYEKLWDNDGILDEYSKQNLRVSSIHNNEQRW